MTKTDLIEWIKLATSKAIITEKRGRLVIVAPKRDLILIECVIQDRLPLGVSVTFNPMTLWQRLTTWSVRFHDWGD